MQMSEIAVITALFAVVGLLIGSFLNVVIYRLPVMLNRAWKKDSATYLEEQKLLPEAAAKTITDAITQEGAFNLMVPRSRCGHCGHKISALENIPVISYCVLGGKCAGCKARISVRYPLIELFTALCFAYCGYHWGLTPTAALWAGFSAVLISLIMIDWDTTLLPDNMTLPLLWAGLLASYLGWTSTALPDAVIGAAAGYLSLWSVYWLFKLATGKEGMGFGDFKLLAALGAWLGAGAILPILLASSIIGAFVGIAMKLTNSLREGGYFPYGPFLGGAGLVIAATGTEWFYSLLLP